jgi:hypothetical protein
MVSLHPAESFWKLTVAELVKNVHFFAEAEGSYHVQKKNQSLKSIPKQLNLNKIQKFVTMVH